MFRKKHTIGPNDVILMRHLGHRHVEMGSGGWWWMCVRHHVMIWFGPGTGGGRWWTVVDGERCTMWVVVALCHVELVIALHH